ncbi:MAG: ACP S-malonyltransferase [Chthoniobacterales bacterium]|nr:ACP S-malonyltransferase [Chthoniobacterales bacterium]
MSRKIALLFAGQGAQTVGMGHDLAKEFTEAADLFQRADEVLGRNLREIAWSGPIEELTRTSNCQPALYVHGLACLSVLREIAGELPITAAAGLSLGEWTAHAAAGTFSFEEGLRLVEQRGCFMEAACEATSGAMAAVIGGDEAGVRRLAAAADVDVANLNSPGQIVVSGDRRKVENAVGLAKEYGIRRATLLNVAGAYHSRLMESARIQVGESLKDVVLQKPSFPVISNVNGKQVDSADEIRQTLQAQVIGTVRWTDCMERMLEMGCDLFLELGPGGVLAGLLQRTQKGAEVLSVSDVRSLQSCVEKLRELDICKPV